VIRDVTNESDAFETSGTTDRTGVVFHETQIARTVRATERFVIRNLAFRYVPKLW